MPLAAVEFTDYETSVSRAFEQARGAEVLREATHILLKPNLVDASPFPVTTPPEFTEAVIRVIRQCSDAELVIAEGCGARTMETDEVFAALGYADLSKRTGVPLLDLNNAPLVRREDAHATVFPEMWLPEVAFTHTVVSLPVLKAHSMSGITGTLKNMMGFAPPGHYQDGGWKKAAFHARLHESVRDLNRYVTPRFTLMDATVGLMEYHLGGPVCDPPVNRILAGDDPQEFDRAAADLLGLDWQQIGHLR